MLDILQKYEEMQKDQPDVVECYKGYKEAMRDVASEWYQNCIASESDVASKLKAELLRPQRYQLLLKLTIDGSYWISAIKKLPSRPALSKHYPLDNCPLDNFVPAINCQYHGCAFLVCHIWSCAG